MLIKGEKFIVDKSVEKKHAGSDSQINEKYLKGEIRIITEQARYPLDTISQLIKSGKYDLNPEYQRRKRWDTIQQSKLIESFIINVPIPPIFIYEVSFAKYEIMDGLQRLTAIDEFYNDKFELKGLEEWSELNGRTYSQLPEKIREGIDRRYLSSIVLLNETAKDVKLAESLKQMVFGRLNSGGDKLEPQESRNALFLGKFNSLCIRLSANDNFRNIWNYQPIKFDKENNILNEDDLLKDSSYREMQDVEMVLRFFAFRQYENLSNFKSQEVYLDEYLKAANKFPDEVLDKLTEIFENTFSLAYILLGKKALYMPQMNNQKKNTPTKTIYDSLIQTISNRLDDTTELIKNKDLIKTTLYKNKEELIYTSRDKEINLFDGKYNSKNNIDSRIEYYNNFFDNILNK